MGEFRKETKEHYRYDRLVEAGHKCKQCGVPVEGLEEVYVACLSYREHKYSVLCVPCFEKRQAKKLGDKTDDAAINKDKPDYEIADIVKGCRHLLMKMRVENDPLCREIDTWDRDRSIRMHRQPMAVAIRAFPFVLTLIANQDFGRVGQYDKYRLELFVKLAIRLRTFLPRVTGQMLERIFRANRDALRKKSEERKRRHEWIKRRDSLPQRLYPITTNEVKFAEWLQRQLPPSVSTVGKAFSLYYENKERDEMMKRLGVDNPEYSIKVDVRVYNTSKGPRFLVTYA
jgi:hypothetical protein